MTNKEQLKALTRELKNVKAEIKELENITLVRLAAANQIEKKGALLKDLMGASEK